MFPFSVEFQLGSEFLPHLHPTASAVESRGTKHRQGGKRRSGSCCCRRSCLPPTPESKTHAHEREQCVQCTSCLTVGSIPWSLEDHGLNQLSHTHTQTPAHAHALSQSLSLFDLRIRTRSHCCMMVGLSANGSSSDGCSVGPALLLTPSRQNSTPVPLG